MSTVGVAIPSRWRVATPKGGSGLYHKRLKNHALGGEPCQTWLPHSPNFKLTHYRKPIALDFLDFTTLDKRRFYCHQEVTLNRRLCPDVYLGVVPITQDGDSFSVEGSGVEVEYAVKMRYLPHELMMDKLLDSNKVIPHMVEKVARKLAEFHRKAELSEQLASIGALDTVTRNNEENFAETVSYVNYTITQGQYERIKDYSHSFLKENARLFAKRVTDRTH